MHFQDNTPSGRFLDTREKVKAREKVVERVVGMIAVLTDIRQVVIAGVTVLGQMTLGEARYDNYHFGLVIKMLFTKEEIGDDSEKKAALGRRIIEEVGYATPEEKENLAISLYPYFGHLYSESEMPRLAQCSVH